MDRGMKIGVITDCFKTGLEESLCIAHEIGFNGVQIYATTGEFSPEALTPEKLERFRAILKGNKLEISALCGDMGGHGFQIAIIDLAQELGTKVVTTHIGVIPADKTHPRYACMLAALTECGRYAAARGVTLAIETGPESAQVLLGFIEDTDGGVGVNLDPANFVMVTGQDPVEAVKLLGKYIVHTHLKDGVMLRRTDPEIIYNHFATGGIDALNVADYFEETPIGQGNVDFPSYIAALREVGYDGYLTVEREAGATPVADIKLAHQAAESFLEEK